MKHTPGPWIADNGGSEVWGIFEESTGGELAYLIKLPLGESSKKFNESEANAHLIALAPELLEFCQEIAQEPYKDSNLESLLETYRVRAKTLIAKVKGE